MAAVLGGDGQEDGHFPFLHAQPCGDVVPQLAGLAVLKIPGTALVHLLAVGEEHDLSTVGGLKALAGAIVLYALGRVFQADRLRRLFAGRFGEVTHLKPEYVDLAESWFSRYEAKAVLICRCIPVVRSLISIPAGFSKMPMGRFLLLTALGSTVWNTVLVSLGAGLGTAWERAMPYLDRYTNIAVIVLAVLAVLVVAALYLRGRKKGTN